MTYIHKPYTLLFFEIMYINVVPEKRTAIPFTNYMLFDNAIFVYYMRVAGKFLFNERIRKGKRKRVQKK